MPGNEVGLADEHRLRQKDDVTEACRRTKVLAKRSLSLLGGPNVVRMSTDHNKAPEYQGRWWFHHNRVHLENVLVHVYGITRPGSTPLWHEAP
jgi:hypothetical protein